MKETKPVTAGVAALAADQLFFAEMRALMEACGPNKNGRLVAVVSASISEGIDTRAKILEVLKRLGFGSQHANIMLNGGTKSMQHDVPWRFDVGTGRYILVP